MKNKSKIPEMVTVMIGGGDESIFIKVPKGKRILTPNGYIIAGETYEENVKRYNDRFDSLSKTLDEENKKYEKELLKKQKPDFMTLMSIKKIKAKVVAHPEVFRYVSKKLEMSVNVLDPHEVYIFKDYSEYKNFFEMYLHSVGNDDIDEAICIYGKKGQIVAYKAICEQIIVKKATEESYLFITDELVDYIHSKGKLTPLEAVEQYESFDLCAPGDAIGSAGYRCKFFDHNCHECLLEYASHKLEHDKFNFELTNFIDNGSSRKRTK